MKPEPDFSALKNLLALKKLEMPLDTEVDRFLIEFHRRQRAQLLVPEPGMARVFGWLRERIEGFRLVPSLSCGAALAALAVGAFFVGVTPQTQVASAAENPYQLSFRMPGSDTAFAMVPTAFTKSLAAPAPASDPLSFTPSKQPTATRFILASPKVAYDATAAF